MSDEKKYLDQEGLAKLWELISQTFVDATSHALEIEDLRALIDEAESKTDPELANRVEALETTVGNTDSKIEEKIAAVVDGAPEAFNTLKELADYVQADDSRTLDMVQRINALEQVKALTEAEIEAICEKVAITTKVADAAEFEAALANNGIIKLTEDISLDRAMSVPAGTEVTLDLAGHTISSPVGANAYAFVANGGKLTITGEGEIAAPGRIAAAANGGTLVMESGFVKSNNSVALGASGTGSKVIVNGGTVESQEGSVLVTSGASAEINGGKLETFDNFALAGNGTAGQGDVNIVVNGGELISNIQSNGYIACGIYMPNTGTLTVNGGHIIANGGAGIVCRGGKTTLNGGEITATAHPTLETGKVGDARVVVPCSAVVYDKHSNYPGSTDLEVIVNKDMILDGAHEDITILSDEAEPKVTDLRA